MIGYRLCQVKAAEHPFFVEAVTTNLYTVEELCYYLYHNPCLIDEDIVSTKLTRWIAEELHLGETALRMEQAMSERSTLADFILPVFQEIRYLSPQETKEYMRQLETLSSGPAWTRLKRKGDALAQNGKYSAADRIYYEALRRISEGTNTEKTRLFLADLWHNIGVTAMYMFEYDEAADAFLKAMKYNPDTSHLTAYLTAMKIAKPDEKYRAAAEEKGVGKEAQKVIDDAYAEASEGTEEEEGSPLRDQLYALVRDYHSAAGIF